MWQSVTNDIQKELKKKVRMKKKSKHNAMLSIFCDIKLCVILQKMHNKIINVQKNCIFSSQKM